MKKIYATIALIVLFMIGFAFYWFEWRPTQIKKECYEVAKQQVKTKYLLSDEGIRETQRIYLLKEKAEKMGLPELPKLPLKEELYLEYGFEDNYKDCLKQNGINE